IASLYRIHEKPDAKRVYDFEVIAATFGYSLGVGALPIQRVHLKADRRSSYGTGKRVREIEVPKEVHITPRMYQKLTEKIAGKPEERILSYLMLRSLKQARYSEENLGHFALTATSYTHFTSPIRRYPDLIVHRILKDVLQSSAGVPPAVAGASRPRESAGVTHGFANDRNLKLPRAFSPHPGRRDAGATQPAATDDPPSPGAQRPHPAAPGEALEPLGGPIALPELHDIAEESSHSERRADDAERDLMEW